MAHACIQSTHVFLHVPARLEQEPSKEKKKTILARSNNPSWVRRTCEVFRASVGTCATTSHPVPACDIRLRPYWHDGSCQTALAIYRRLSRGTSRPCPLPASADTIISPVLISLASQLHIFTCSLHGSQAGCAKEMTYSISQSTSRTVERRTKRPSTGDTFLGRARAWGSSSFFQLHASHICSS
jgi:hypothetical protein